MKRSGVYEKKIWEITPIKDWKFRTIFEVDFGKKRDQRSEGESSTLEFREVEADSRIRKKKITFFSFIRKHF